MERPLRLLIVDDQANDAELSAMQIARGGFPCTWRRVETESDFRRALRSFGPDLILSDFTLPQYDGLSALDLAHAEAPRTPFIFVSGSIGESRAMAALSSGATDYVPKGDLARLVPAVARALHSDSRAHTSADQKRSLQHRQPPEQPSVDGLTRLPNRAAFSERLTIRLRETAEARDVCVMIFDIQHLADINEAHGRAVGDQLILDFAARLQRRFGADGDLAYFGGGTFAAAFNERRRHIELTHDSVTPVFGHSFTCGEHPIHVVVQCGLARFPSDGQGAVMLLGRAEAALDALRGLQSCAVAADSRSASRSS